MWKPSPDFTWGMISAVFWFSVCWTVYCNYADCKESTISYVIANKANDNYWIPAICMALISHWFWGLR